jgi:hypothetical protein
MSGDVILTCTHGRFESPPFPASWYSRQRAELALLSRDAELP